MSDCSMPVVSLEKQNLSKLTELTTIYQHVWDISRKIAEMEGDPLPEQLEQSVPGYAAWLKKHTESLQRNKWPFVLTGDNKAVLLSFLMSYLGEEPLMSLPTVCHDFFIYLGYHHRQYAKVVPNDTTAEPFIVQNWEGLGCFLESLRERNKSSPDSPHHIEIYMPIPILQGNLQFIIPPISCMESDNAAEITKHMNHAHGLLYVMDERENMSLQLRMLLSHLLKDPQINHHFLSMSSCKVVVHSPKEQRNVVNENKGIRDEIKQFLPMLHSSSVISTNIGCYAQEQAKDRNGVHQSMNGQKPMSDNPNSVLSESDVASPTNLVPHLPIENHHKREPGDVDVPVGTKHLTNAQVLCEKGWAKPDLCSSQIENLISSVNKSLQQTLVDSVAGTCQSSYSWLYSYIGRVMHHLNAFLSQAEKSQEERFATHTEILTQLQQLTGQTDDFFDSLRKEVDSKLTEAISLLRSYLLRDDVISRISSWTETEAPDDDIWSEIDHDIRKEISNRIHSELIRWEQANQFFKNLSPCLIVHFEQRFLPIEHQLIEVETRIARHDSQVTIAEVGETEWKIQVDDDHERVSWLPEGINLKWQQKVLLSVAAPVLLPLAVTIALLGLPVIGGLMAKDLIAERLAENKMREYNSDKIRYLRRRTVEEVTKFCSSRALEEYVQSELQPAYQCVERLQKIVPSQIEANKSQIASLKSDFREAKDVVRFYQPLVEVFDHYKMLLMLYKVLHMKREKLDIDPTNLEVACDAKWTSVGLKGSIKPGYLKDDDRKKLVSVKFFKMKLDLRNVDDYLQEEAAYRFQASTYIAKFLGLCKLPRGEFTHILEPLKCNLRQYVRGHNVLGAKDMSDEKQRMMKNVMLGVVRGLDYLHERGWVHFDLNMDSVCVDFNNHVKLINISSRRMYCLPPDLNHSDIYKYTHLPHEVLMTPPSAYTHLSEMYCVGIMMWELWTGERAYYFEIGHPEMPLNTMHKFVEYIEQNRPKLDMFYNVEGDPTCKFAELWVSRLTQCWSETDRLSSKAWLQLMDDTRMYNMPIAEQHFTS